MVSIASPPLYDTLAWGYGTLDGEAGSAPITFLPEAFFLGRTEGDAVVRQLGGRQRRCDVVTTGQRDGAYGAVQFHEVFTYDDGEVDTWRWVMAPGSDGRYVASEALAGPGLIGHIEHGDYHISFNRPLSRRRPFPQFRYSVRFTQLSPDTARKQTTVSLLGLRLATMTAYHHRRR